MFKKTFRERVRSSLIRFGRKNRICYIPALLALAVSGFAFRLWDALAGNWKKLCMTFVSCLFFAVYSSFSFPSFIGSQTITGSIDFGEVDSSVRLVEAETIDEAVVSEEVTQELSGESTDNYVGMESEEIERFDAADILAELEDADFVSADPVVEEEPSVTVSGAMEPHFSEDDWRLILVNKQHFIPEDYEFPLGTIRGSLQCDERILEDLLNMLKAAQDDGVSLQIQSPYRTENHQTELFDRKITSYMRRGMSYMEAYRLSSQAVTIPNASEHQIGLALDIICPSHIYLDEAFGDTEAGKWLAANSAHYGFILRYPKGKEYITTVEFEPWHFRYVGKEAAEYITEKGITLEEFWEEVF
ncbi:MAG: M15 family metallopeptidase [Lachnospiraceae bacterium]|nr:M15 family metallopeptidase [Lachnospiraceae bacterium]